MSNCPFVSLCHALFDNFFAESLLSGVASRIGTAGACGLSARVMSGCLKLPSLRVFRGQ